MCRWAYAVYASCGSLDLEARDAISMEALKHMICVPVYLVKRSDVQAAFDSAWTELVVSHPTAAALVRDKLNDQLGPDGLPLPYTLFSELIHKTSFAKFMEVAKPFGKRGIRCPSLSRYG